MEENESIVTALLHNKSFFISHKKYPDSDRHSKGKGQYVLSVSQEVSDAIVSDGKIGIEILKDWFQSEIRNLSGWPGKQIVAGPKRERGKVKISVSDYDSIGAEIIDPITIKYGISHTTRTVQQSSKTR